MEERKSELREAFDIMKYVSIIWISLLGGFLGGLSKVDDYQKKVNLIPISVIAQSNSGKSVDLNGDGLGDRIIISEAGLYQEQFGYKNPQTGELEYLTRQQLLDRAKRQYQKDLKSIENKF